MPDSEDRADPRSPEERLGLLERDVRSHARSLTALVKSGTSFSNEQMDQLEELLVKVLGNAGLRVDEADHVDEARKDFAFVRSLRTGVNGTASKIGWFVIAAILGGVLWLVTNGLTFWKTH